MVRLILFITIILGFVARQANAQIDQIIVHDPVAIEHDGRYYLYNTGEGIASWVSDDLKNWDFLGKVFNEPPEWAKKRVPKFNGNIWAPDVIFHNGIYYLYYSISSFASNRSCIGVATNVTLNPDDDDYKWEDHGAVVQSVPGRDNWNAIDPNLAIDENNQPWMAFGSFWGGLKIVRLSSDLLSPAEPQEWYTIAKRDRDKRLGEADPGNGAIEAPFIFKKDGYYYLFVSFDLCCRGSNSTYNVRVGRSEKITGPYYDRDGVSMLEGGGTYIVGPNDDFYGMGHNSAYHFNGNDYFFCHAYDKNDRGRPKLVTKILDWDSEGWPTIH
ncbi:MAG: arabinan endo-1,5-alpha-L-arabinosidase [Prolixibacteraceae bacterium]|nr:arabinan endo-1,5-alpha-L-arabinosidase [Prolixibacteraceae bacterium]